MICAPGLGVAPTCRYSTGLQRRCSMKPTAQKICSRLPAASASRHYAPRERPTGRAFGRVARGGEGARSPNPSRKQAVLGAAVVT